MSAGSSIADRPAMRARRTATRMRVAFLAIAFVLSLFCARLFQLQGVDANAYAAMAQAEGSRTVVLYAARGEILDRSGEALADSVDGVALTADPTQTAEKAPQIAALLTSRLDLDYFATVERLRTPDTQFVYLARQVPRWRGEAIREALLARGLVGVYTERDPLRNYPNGVVAAPVVGRTGADGSGQSGLELAYDETLTGTDGSATYDISVSGERLPVSSSDNEDPQSGQSVQTTLDRDLQWFADVRLAEGVRTTSADWGVAVTMDTRTGQLLQLSQAPGFNPRDDDLSGDELRVKALEDVYEPGSVQKVLTFGALLDSGAIDPDTKITVPGSLPVGGEVVHDDVPHGTWRLTATGVIARSSNIGTVIASQQIEDQELFDYLRAFGLGSTTDLGLAGETAGILSDPATWLPIQRANIAFGQGVAVNALQMAAAVNTIANDGVYVAPQLVAGTVNADGELAPSAAPETRRVISARAARSVALMMETVTHEGGTAPETGIAGYRVAGKTGTAQRVDPVNGGYAGRTISYVSFAPADEPRFLTYVVLDNAEGHFGSTGAGPVVKDIMSMALKRYRIPPTGSQFPRQHLTW